MSWANVAIAGAGLVGGMLGGGGGDDRAAAIAAAREGELRSAGYFGHGGAEGRVRVGPDGWIGIDSDLGNLGPLRNALIQLTRGRLGASTQGVDPRLAGAARDATGSLGNINTGAAGSFGFADKLLQSGIFSGLQNRFGSSIRSALGTAGRDIDDLAAERLGILREQAQPFEERAFSDLQDNLFATGRSGTTGGGIQTEAFARGLGQADLGRQLSALDTARAVQGDAANRANSFASSLAGFRGLEDSLVNTAFGRALQGAGLNSDRALSRFNIAGSVVDSRLRNQVTQQGLGLQALEGVGGIDATGLQNVMAALQAAGLRSSSALGVANAIGGVSGQSTDAGIGNFANFVNLLGTDFGGSGS